jgi:hypothetical protein
MGISDCVGKLALLKGGVTNMGAFCTFPVFMDIKAM